MDEEERLTIVDRGPSTVEDDAPQTPEGMWRLLHVRGMRHDAAMALAHRHYSWATMERAGVEGLTKLVGRGLARTIMTEGIPTAPLPTTTDARPLTPWSPGYPLRLRDSPVAPPLVWVRGSLPTSGRALAVVGPDVDLPYATAVATRAVRGAVDRDLVTIAGLGAGIDALVARTTVHAGGRHIAVLATGVDQPEDTALADAVLAAGGALLSEQPPDAPATEGAAVARYRIVSALADALLLTAGAPASLVAYAARATLAEGRPLWVPRPSGGHASDRSVQLLLALSDPQGLVDPAAVHASGRNGSLLANRRPCADLVLPDGEALDSAIAALAGGV